MEGRRDISRLSDRELLEEVLSDFDKLRPDGGAHVVEDQDVLHFEMINHDATENFNVHWAILLASGKIQRAARTISGTSGATANGQWPLQKGLLLYVQVQSTTSHQFGRCFAFVELRKGTLGGSVAPTPYRSLIQDYVSIFGNPTWPPTSNNMTPDRQADIVITGTNPAAGAAFTYTVPDYTRLFIQSIRFDLVTDGNAATRSARILVVDSSSNDLFRAISNVSHTLSTTKSYYFGAAYPIRDNTLASQVIEPLPFIDIVKGMKLSISPNNMQVGDQISAIRMATKFQTVRI